MPVSATRFSLRKKHRKLIKKSRNILVIFIIYVLVHHVDWDSLDEADPHAGHAHAQFNGNRNARQFYNTGSFGTHQKAHPDEGDAWNSRIIIRKPGVAQIGNNQNSQRTTPPVIYNRNARDSNTNNNDEPPIEIEIPELPEFIPATQKPFDADQALQEFFKAQASNPHLNSKDFLDQKMKENVGTQF